MEKSFGNRAVNCFNVPFGMNLPEMRFQNGAGPGLQGFAYGKSFCGRLFLKNRGHGIVHDLYLATVKPQSVCHVVLHSCFGLRIINIKIVYDHFIGETQCSTTGSFIILSEINS